MRATTATFAVTLVLSGALGAQSLQNAWPPKIQLQDVQVESSAPALLPPGSYTLDLVQTGGRWIGRLHRGSDDFDAIPFSVSGCEGAKQPNFAKRATARALPAAGGPGAGGPGRVELKILSADTKGCAITGAFKAKDDPIPSGRPNPGGPDQLPSEGGADLSIRAARPGGPEKLNVQVYNDGPAKSAPTQLKFFYHKDGKVTTAQAPIPMIAAKASVWITVGAGLPLAAADSVTVRADDPNVVHEKNELNNGFIYKK